MPAADKKDFNAMYSPPLSVYKVPILRLNLLST